MNVYKLYNVQGISHRPKVAVFYEQNLAGNITSDERKAERVLKEFLPKKKKREVSWRQQNSKIPDDMMMKTDTSEM